MTVRQDFTYTGAAQSFTVPAGVTSLAVAVTGADGGGAGAGTGGTGAALLFTLAVTPGETIYVFCGGHGGHGNYTSNTAPGWNGGGYGGFGYSIGGGGGGGASDIRVGGSATSNIIAIAGGGGGASGLSTGSGASGGGGGAPVAGSAPTGQGTNGGVGGSQTAGGAAGNGGTAGSAFQGGNGGGNSVSYGGGGGGGGYYGGGGGGLDGGTGANSSAGGGGSSWFATGAGITATSSSRGGLYVNGGGDTNNGSVSFFWSAPPNAPTINMPQTGANIDYTLPLSFSWNFSDPDAGDTQASADIRWRVGTGAWTTITGATTTGQSYTSLANAWSGQSGQTVEWQVRTTDNNGSTGPWSTSYYFIPRPHPAAPTITPTPVLTSSTPSFSFTTPYGYVQGQERIVADSGGSANPAIIYAHDEYGISPPQTSHTSTPPSYGYLNGMVVHMQVRTSQYNEVYSDWADSGPITAVIGAAPLAPTLTLSADPTSATIAVRITNPGSDPHPPDHNDVYRTQLDAGTPEIRVATGVALNSTYIDRLPGAGNVRYRVVAVGPSGGSTSSA